jgi:hypothetical protein
VGLFSRALKPWSADSRGEGEHQCLPARAGAVLTGGADAGGILHYLDQLGRAAA